ncbi:hypothetical protein LZC95_16620 [Pendulispora brunnea]|uniref:Peptidase C-terminal archaeal/bacterial domain-containing protein n=1 Tax=Pendulispora brunnea TaxID=2905690 RepID=A0ABZ2KK59_9BACT
MRRASLHVFCLLAVALAIAACATTRGSELEPRYVALHNAFAAMGLAQVGPLQRGSLAEGREMRFPVELTADCTTIALFGGQGVRDLDATLLDASGAVVARDATKDSQAVLRACVDAPGAYTLLVRMASGAGEFMAASWTGGPGLGPRTGASSSALASLSGTGTCDSPIALAPGSFTGSTSRGESEHEGSCSSSTSREVVYRFELTARKRVTIDVNPHFDSVIYLRKDDCADPDAEIACNDDAPHEHDSHLDEELDPGVYYLFVDGYSSESGTFKLNVVMNDVPTLEEVCQSARVLSTGLVTSGSTRGLYDHVRSSGCGDTAKGPDTPYRFDLTRRSRVRIVERSSDFSTVLYVRKRCTDAKSEMACADAGFHDGEATFAGMLEAGSYTVVADATDREADGSYSLFAEVGPENGQVGTPGDTCADAMPLGNLDASASGDTFLARDDLSVRCGGTGTPDVVYRLEVAKRSRIVAQLDHQEGSHVLALRKNCSDVGTEFACSASIDRTVEPGVYYLIVDGDPTFGLGRFSFAFRMREVAGQENACRAPKLLGHGQTAKGTTAGGGDKFVASCAGSYDGQASPDAVYRIVVPSRGRVRLNLTATGFSPVLALRRSCLDGGGGVPEVACNADASSNRAHIDTTLDAGTYFAVIDGQGRGSQGAYALEYAFSGTPSKSR